MCIPRDLAKALKVSQTPLAHSSFAFFFPYIFLTSPRGFGNSGCDGNTADPLTIFGASGESALISYFGAVRPRMGQRSEVACQRWPSYDEHLGDLTLTIDSLRICSIICYSNTFVLDFDCCSDLGFFLSFETPIRLYKTGCNERL